MSGEGTRPARTTKKSELLIARRTRFLPPWEARALSTAPTMRRRTTTKKPRQRLAWRWHTSTTSRLRTLSLRHQNTPQETLSDVCEKEFGGGLQQIQFKFGSALLYFCARDEHGFAVGV